MGTGKTKSTAKKAPAKKKSTKKKKEANPEKDLLKQRLKDTGPFVLRDFCSQHGMDPSDSKKANISKLISFLVGKFDEGEITINDLYPEDPDDVDLDNDVDDDDDDGEEEEAPKKSKSKDKASKKKAKKSKPKDDDDDDLEDDDDPEDDDDSSDNDDDDISDDDDDDLGDDDDVDECDDDDGEDDDDDEPKSKGKGKTKKDSSGLEDKVDKLIDASTKLGSAVEELYKTQAEHKAFSRLVSVQLLKSSGMDKTKVSKLMKKIESKAKELAGTDDQEEE